jgi:23S rRNA (cytosine1962-C5)-methyltransferase
MRAVRLHKNKEKAILNRHHWIFSGAVKSAPEFEDGDMLPVESASGDRLGWAYFNRRCSIFGRMVAFGDEEPTAAVVRNLENAVALRAKLFDPTQTDAFRLVNGEGDGLPGLIADQYADTIVVQISTLGMERLKPTLTETLRRLTNPRAIRERSDGPARREEGLPPTNQTLWGEEVREVEIVENGLRFCVDVERGQKTGFFLDQREMRAAAARYAAGRRMLNCFAYTGGFSVAALRGGATRADSVDLSHGAAALARRNLTLNGFSESDNDFFVADVFEHLRATEREYDFIVLDPPAFAKRKDDTVRACRGYKEINRVAMMKVARRGVILTSSCSHFIDEKLFQQVAFQAAAEAGRTVRIIERHRLAPDHPINIFHPEGGYLKSLLLYVE